MKALPTYKYTLMVTGPCLSNRLNLLGRKIREVLRGEILLYTFFLGACANGHEVSTPDVQTTDAIH